MGTLADKLKQTTRDANGQLTEQTPEEVQSLAAKAGLASAPLTPAGTAAIGGNPNQQKMAGAPNQKQAALSMSMQPGKDLATATREGQVRNQATATEQQTQQKSQDLQALGGVGDRVNDLINAQRARIASAAPVEAQAADQFNGKDLSTVKPLLAQLRANPSDMNLQLQVNQALGYDVSRQLSPDEINSLYESSVDTIAKGANGNVDHDLTVSDLIDGGHMGYDAPTLSHLLGVPESQLSTMTVAQLRNQINKVQADEFSKSHEVDNAQQSTQLGSAERQLAHQAGQEAARVGTRSSEADVQKVEQAIANGDQVTFGGKQYSVEDLLSDGKISDIISNYMNSSPGSPERTQLEQSEPGLMKFINDNQALLADASQKLAAGATQFQGVQEQNKQTLSALPDNVVKALIPGGQTLSASAIDPNQYPLLGWAQKNPQQAATLSTVSADDVSALSRLKPEELDALQIGTAGGKWDQYLADNKRVQTLRDKAAHATSPDEIVDMMFGGQYSGGYSHLQEDFQNEKAKAALGLPNNLGSFSSVSSNGQLLTPDQMKDKAANVPRESVAEVLAGQHPTTTYTTPTATNNATMSPVQQKISSTLSKAMADGTVSSDELSNSGLSVDEMLQIDPHAAFGGHEKDYIEGLRHQVFAEAQAHHPNDAAGQLKEIEGQRDSIAQKLSQNRFQGSDVINAFSDSLGQLNKQMTDAQAAGAAKQKSDTLQAAQSKWDSQYGKLQQNKDGKWGFLYNGMWNGAPTPPPRPS